MVLKPFIIISTLFLLFLFFPFQPITHNLSTTADAFSEGGCDPDCKKCHSLNNQEVGNILKKMNLSHAKITGIQISPAKGLWEISIDDKGEKGIFYVDFAKKHIVVGNIIEIDTGSNKTLSNVKKTHTNKKIDISKIPLENALVMGNKKASKKVVVFTDPDCPFCGKLHQEMKKVLEKRKDIVFYIKLYPLKMHKDAYWKSKSIVCNNSLKLLEDNFDKKPIPKTECNTKEIDNTIRLAESLDITGTPTIILPDGRVYSGMVPADRLINLINRGK